MLAPHPLLAPLILLATLLLSVVLLRGWQRALRAPGLTPLTAAERAQGLVRAGRWTVGLLLVLVTPVTLALLALAAYWRTGACSMSYWSPTNIALGWAFRHGQELYPPLAGGACYGTLYGPAYPLYNAALNLLFGPDMLVNKLGAMLPVWLGAALTYRLLRPALAPAGALALVALVLLTAWFPLCETHPDGLQFALAAVIVWGYQRVRRTAANGGGGGRLLLGALALGALGGVLADLKPHAALVLLPVVIALARHARWGALWALVATALGVAALPFLTCRTISVENYLDYLLMGARIGWKVSTLATDLTFLVLLAWPLASLAHYLRTWHTAWWRALHLECSWEWGATGLAFLLTLVPAAKNGGGTYHFLPLLPLLAFWLAQAWPPRPLSAAAVAEAAATAPPPPALVSPLTLWAGAALPLALLVVPLLLTRAAFCLDLAPLARDGLAYGRQVQRDLAEIERQHPGAKLAMGYGEAGSVWRTTAVRSLLAQHGQPLYLELGSVNDLVAAGNPPTGKARDAMGRIRAASPTSPFSDASSWKITGPAYWLLPRAERWFDVPNLYQPATPNFSEQFRADFRSLYYPAEHTATLDVWHPIHYGLKEIGLPPPRSPAVPGSDQ